jgi:hypothetical protein
MVLEHISQKAQELIKQIDAGIEWLQKHQKNTKENTSEECIKLKKNKCELTRIANANQRPTIAVFGPSQHGKSCMTNNILGNNDKLELIDCSNNDNLVYNFLEKINPKGGQKEATGVITRFTFVNKPSQNIPAIKIKLLTARDLILLFITAYQDNIAGKRIVSKNEIDEILKKTQTNNQKQNYLNENDIYIIESHLFKKYNNSDNYIYLETFKENNFWTRLAELIDIVPSNKWGDIFEVLWGNNTNITQLFKKLVIFLEKVSFSEFIYTDFEALLLENGALLNVDLITNELCFNDNDEKIASIANAKKSISVFFYKDKSLVKESIPRDVLSALTFEVIISLFDQNLVNNYNASLIKDTDILDFPGARTPDEKDQSVLNDPINLGQLILRGKVAYLFDNYSFNYELSVLLYVIGDIQLNVKGIKRILSNWIYQSVGIDEQRRNMTLNNSEISPLFIILSWWNRQLFFDSSQDTENGTYTKKSLERKWKARYSQVLDHCGDTDWFKNWVGEKPFDNIYLLRSFAKQKDETQTFNYDESSGNEHEYKDSTFISILKESYKESNEINKLLVNPNYHWENSSVPNKDGSEYIIENVKKVANNKIRESRFKLIYQDIWHQTEKLLKDYYIDNDQNARIEQAKRIADNIKGEIHRKTSSNKFDFGAFIESLTIHESDFYNFYTQTAGIVIQKIEENNYIIIRQSVLRQYGGFIKKNNPIPSAEQQGALNAWKGTVEENKISLVDKLNWILLSLNWGYETSIEDTQKRCENEKISSEILFYAKDDEISGMTRRSDIVGKMAIEKWHNDFLNEDHFKKLLKGDFETRLLTELFINLKEGSKKVKLDSVISDNIREIDNNEGVSGKYGMFANVTAIIINNFVRNLGWFLYQSSNNSNITAINKLIESNSNYYYLKAAANSSEKHPFHSASEDEINAVFAIQESGSETDQMQLPMNKNELNWCDYLTLSFMINSCEMNPNLDINANSNLKNILEQVQATVI